ncbi:GNAT family N-acetyltransferase [Arthrobacter sp. APC 3897]|uniref:GNAT family N-acetyltransferase n=1 Tax=Arthrobacter sp. APC 3897 TaxID=3035204 RepID=UPI0025B5E133|nr:GNAT family N-acetyltransferase [Arthrobacter sp. APC 3897]MDN3482922.1 GNAT family N-acetyltransferase [Arthrobacter sp. APC 3897]
MVTIAACQELHEDWLRNLAGVTRGRTFATDESEWAWLPARRQLVLLYPQRISPAGIRPGLSEGIRLGAQSVSVWMNNAVNYAPLEAFGFRRGPQPIWMSAPVTAPQQYSADAASIDQDPPEVTGPDAVELAAGRSHPRTAWHLTTRGDGKLTGRAWVYDPSAADQQSNPPDPITGRPTIPAAPARKPGKGSLAGIFGLTVGPSSRRNGYGTALLSRAASVAAAAGADRLAINAAPGGYELCSARGFDLIGRGQYLFLDMR